MRNWLKHLRGWLACFPARDYHAFTSVVGESAPEECLICGATRAKEQSEVEWGRRYLARQPETLLRDAGEALLRRFLANLTRLTVEDLKVVRRMRSALDR